MARATHMSQSPHPRTLISSSKWYQYQVVTRGTQFSSCSTDACSSPSAMERSSSSPSCQLLLLLLAMAAAGLSSGTVHRVGDDSGWTIIGNMNYSAWASSRDFHAGDTLLFVYNKQFHNVLEVTKQDYRLCNATNPVAIYASGNNTVPVTGRRHTFYICGVPGHCQLGQKVDIRVPKASTVGSATPGTAPAGAPALEHGVAGRLSSCGWVGFLAFIWLVQAFGNCGVW